MRHIFVSPNMDDAVLSAADLMLDLISKRKKVLVVTVFTEFGTGPLSLAARLYLLGCGFLSLPKFSQQRHAEDLSAMEKLGAEYSHLRFIDAGFRVRKKIGFLSRVISLLGFGSKFRYPYHNERSLFSGKILPEEGELVEKVRISLRKIIETKDVLYGPLGLGGHVDHLVVREAIIRFKNKKYFWADQPYVSSERGKQELTEIERNQYRKMIVPKHKEKQELINCYYSQKRCGGRSWQFGAEEFYEIVC